MTNLKFNIKYYTIKLLAFFGLSIKRDVDLHQSLMTELFMLNTGQIKHLNDALDTHKKALEAAKVFTTTCNNELQQKNLEIQKLAEGNKLLRDGWASQRALKVEVEGLRNVHAVLSGENEAYRQECSRLTQEADRLRWAKSALKRELTDTQTMLKTTENQYAYAQQQMAYNYEKAVEYKTLWLTERKTHAFQLDSALHDNEKLKKKLAKEEASRICFEFHATMYEQFICDMEGSIPVENGVPITAAELEEAKEMKELFTGEYLKEVRAAFKEPLYIPPANAYPKYPRGHRWYTVADDIQEDSK